jgi:hypothetical protein
MQERNTKDSKKGGTDSKTIDQSKTQEKKKKKEPQKGP